VRVHTDAKAAESAKAVSAHAYTVGNHIVFGSGEYSVGNATTYNLMAHELTHTLQQGKLKKSGKDLSPRRIDGNDSAEKEASLIAAEVLAGNSRSVLQSSGVSSIQRIPWGKCPTGEQINKIDQRIYSRAESAIVGNYVVGRPKDLIATNENPLKDLKSDNPLIQLAKAHFYDNNKARLAFGKKRDDKALLYEDAVELDTDSDEDVSTRGFFEAQQDYKVDNSEMSLKAPDILDFATLRVFDVTTYGGAKRKGGKIKNTYVRLLKEITSETFLRKNKYPPSFIQLVKDAKNGTEFSAGTSVDFPQPLSISFPVSDDTADKERISFCKTDLDDKSVMGVLQYIAIRCETQECLDAANAAGTQAPEVPRQPYDIVIGSRTLGFQIGVPAVVTVAGSKNTRGSPQELPWIRLNDELNFAMASSIPGLTFLRVQRLPGSYDKIAVAIATQTEENTGGLRLKIQPSANLVALHYHKDRKQLTKQTGKDHIPFEFPGLSSGELTDVSYGAEKGLSGKGVIRPSIPLLRGAVLQIAFSGEELRVTAPVPKDKLKSLPGLRITEAGLNFELSPEFKPSGDIKFEIGPKQKPLGSGSISVSADEKGFLAQGDLNARVPGFDESTTKVTYRKETGWEGETKLRTSKDFVKNADVTVRLNDQGLDVVGNLSIALPGDQTIDLSVAKSQNGNSITFKGAGEFKVPGNKLKPVKLDFIWDDEKLTATGETGFEFKGFSGRMNVRYQDGKVSGNGGLDFVNGKAKGKLNIKMSPEQTFSGDGEVTYKLTDNLIATAGIAIDDKEKVTLKGALEFPKPIELFKPFGGEKEIFSAGVSIPIPGASIGPVGLKARIEGGLSAGYRIGPGELRSVKLQTMLNPFEENPDVDLKLSAQLYIGVNAHISGSISGAIMVDAAIASASGGLRVTVTAELDGHLAADSMIEYKKGHFSVEGNLDVLLKLLLKLALDSFVKAESGVEPFKAKTEKDWRLAAYTYDPGIQIGIRSKAPIRYDSSQAFQAPSLDQIEIVKPNLNLPDMMQKIFASSASSEVEKK
jgi:hypothetical protein